MRGTRTVRQMLNHISVVRTFALMLHRDNPAMTDLAGYDWAPLMAKATAAEQANPSKAQLLQDLRDGGEEFANFVSGLSDEFLGQVITMPAGGNPPARTRFDMLIAAKEHEMHHRGQLMLIERMLGITPHLTREREAAMAAMQAAQSAKQ